LEGEEGAGEGGVLGAGGDGDGLDGVAAGGELGEWEADAERGGVRGFVDAGGSEERSGVNLEAIAEEDEAGADRVEIDDAASGGACAAVALAAWDDAGNWECGWAGTAILDESDTSGNITNELIFLGGVR
jgi:hypothetical protein